MTGRPSREEMVAALQQANIPFPPTVSLASLRTLYEGIRLPQGGGDRADVTPDAQVAAGENVINPNRENADENADDDGNVVNRADAEPAEANAAVGVNVPLNDAAAVAAQLQLVRHQHEIMRLQREMAEMQRAMPSIQAGQAIATNRRVNFHEVAKGIPAFSGDDAQDVRIWLNSFNNLMTQAGADDVMKTKISNEAQVIIVILRLLISLSFTLNLCLFGRMVLYCGGTRFS